MFSAIVSPKRGMFFAYTALGYLSLVIHQCLFARSLGIGATKVHITLALFNLVAGSWCFLSALRVAWVAGEAMRRQ